MTERRPFTKRHTWAELERQGVKRCCVMFSDGKQCRRRVAENAAPGESWCAKHAPEMKAHTAWHMKIVEDQKRKDDA